MSSQVNSMTYILVFRGAFSGFTVRFCLETSVMLKMKVVCFGKMDRLDDMRKYVEIIHFSHFDSSGKNNDS